MEDVEADRLMFTTPPFREKRGAGRPDSAPNREMAPILEHPNIPLGVHQALEEVQADFVRKPHAEGPASMTAAFQKSFAQSPFPPGNESHGMEGAPGPKDVTAADSGPGEPVGEKRERRSLSIGRVSVTIRAPEIKEPPAASSPQFAVEKMASRYFMGDA